MRSVSSLNYFSRAEIRCVWSYRLSQNCICIRSCDASKKTDVKRLFLSVEVKGVCIFLLYRHDNGTDKTQQQAHRPIDVRVQFGHVSVLFVKYSVWPVASDSNENRFVPKARRERTGCWCRRL